VCVQVGDTYLDCDGGDVLGLREVEDDAPSDWRKPKKVWHAVCARRARGQLEREPRLGVVLKRVRVVHAARGRGHVVIGRDLREGRGALAICRHVVGRRGIPEMGRTRVFSRLWGEHRV
jgi:hypothetical protein